MTRAARVTDWWFAAAMSGEGSGARDTGCNVEAGSAFEAIERVDGLGVRCAREGRFAGGFEATIDIDRLAASLAQVNIATCPGVPVSAVRKRQLEYMAGRLCAEAALDALDRRVAIDVDPRGRPLWPDGLTGSIAHTDGFAIAIALPRRGGYEAGIDVERVIERPSTLRAVRARCLADGEIAADAQALTVIFCAKEAYFKAVNRALDRFIDFGEMRSEPFESGADRVVLSPVSDASLPAAEAEIAMIGDRLVARVLP